MQKTAGGAREPGVIKISFETPHTEHALPHVLNDLDASEAISDQDGNFEQGPPSLPYVHYVAARLPAVNVEEHNIIETARKLEKRDQLCSNLFSDFNFANAPRLRRSVVMDAKGRRPTYIFCDGHYEPLWRALDIIVERAHHEQVPDSKDNADEDRDLQLEFWELYHRQTGKRNTTQMAKIRAMNAPKDVQSRHKALISPSKKILQEYQCFEELERDASPSPLARSQVAVRRAAEINVPESLPGEVIERAPSRCSSVTSIDEVSEVGDLDEVRHAGSDDSESPTSTFLTVLPSQAGSRNSRRTNPEGPPRMRRQNSARRHGGGIVRGSHMHKLANEFDEQKPRHKPLRSFKGFDDYKQSHQIAKSEKLTCRLNFTTSAKNWLKSSVEKPQYAMSMAVREHKQACQWRLRGDRQQEVEKPEKNFHRPWSREKPVEQSPKQEEEAVKPLERLAKVCCRSGLHPQPETIRFLAKRPPMLNLRNSGYGDADILALTAALPHTSHERLESVDLGENRRLADASVCMLLKALATRHWKTIHIIRLDYCNRLNNDTIELCTQLLEQTLNAVQVLDLSGIKIRMKEYTRLAEVIREHPCLNDVRLAETGLGRHCQAREGVMSHLMSNHRIQALDISWNSLDAPTFQTLGRGLARHQNLKSLALANTGPLSDPVVNGSPLLIFLEFLAFDKSLTKLDISNNALDHHAPLVLESAACNHPNLAQLDISRNPLGLRGMRSLLRLVANEGCPQLKDISIAECTSGNKSFDNFSPYDGDPSGKYTLDLEQPGQRAAFRLLFTRLCTGPWAALPASIMSGTLSSTGEDKPFCFKNLAPNAAGYLEVPTSGKLALEVKPSKMLVMSEDPNVKATPVVEEMIRRLRLTLSSERKTLAVLGLIKSIGVEHQWQQMLDALSQDFTLTPEQAQGLFFTRSKHLTCARDPAETCVRLLPCVIGVSRVAQVAKSIPTFRDLVRIHSAAYKLLTLNLENPAGRYSLAVSLPIERNVLERLLLLNRWEEHMRLAAGRPDISQHGNGKNFRNEVSGGRSFTWEATSWRVPSEATLVFDYVSLRRPPVNAVPLLDEAWGRMLDRIREAVYKEPEEEVSDSDVSTVPSRPLSSCLEDREKSDTEEPMAVKRTNKRRHSSVCYGGLPTQQGLHGGFLSSDSRASNGRRGSAVGSAVAPYLTPRRSSASAALKTRRRSQIKSKMALMRKLFTITALGGAEKFASGGADEAPPPSKTPLGLQIGAVSEWKHKAVLQDRPSLVKYLKRPSASGAPERKIAAEGKEEKKRETKEACLDDADVLWALSCASSQLFLDCYQLRELLCILYRPDTRADALVSFFARTIDWPINGKMCRSKFCKVDWERVRKRIGHINVLDFLQVENTRLSYDLSMNEERLACHMFIGLHFAERKTGDNLRELRIDWAGNFAQPNWSSFQSGLPLSWERLESIPARGIFEGRYVCSRETAKLKMRRKNAVTLGGWTCLPEQEEVLSPMVRPWSVADEIPEAVLIWMEFVMANFTSWHEAFNQCDEITDGSLTQQEFVNGFKALGFQVPPEVDDTNRREIVQYLTEMATESLGEDAPPEPWQIMSQGGSLQTSTQPDIDTFELDKAKKGPAPRRLRRAATSPLRFDPLREIATIDVLINTYKFLDPDNDMKVTEDEFGAIAGLWREFKQSTWELVCHIRERFGSVEKAWRYAAQKVEDGCLDRKQFSELARSWGFEGPVQQTFTCLDSYRVGLISRRDWIKLEDADPPRRPGARRRVVATLRRKTVEAKSVQQKLLQLENMN